MCLSLNTNLTKDSVRNGGLTASPVINQFVLADLKKAVSARVWSQGAKEESGLLSSRAKTFSAVDGSWA